jgi:large subunit ribosomal protein L13
MAGQLPGATRSAKPGEVPARWYVVDATDVVLGRLASTLAARLRGKHRALYTPHVDTGDFVIVVNAKKVKLTGRKAERKVYYRHSGWAGALRSTTAGKILAGKHPERLVQQAVRGMLPKNTLGRKLLRKLKVYAGPAHPHAAQQPEELRLA